MKNSDLTILRKIIQYCTEIELTLDRFNPTRDEFVSDFVIKNAVAMCILQIGELVSKLTDEFKAKHTTMPWREIKGMRNIAAHNYGQIDPDILWETANDDISILKEFCIKVIQEIN